jgi:hypothetical protein
MNEVPVEENQQKSFMKKSFFRHAYNFIHADLVVKMPPLHP